MSTTERTNARLCRKLSIGGFDFYALSDRSNGRRIMDLMVPAGTKIRFLEAR